MTLATSVSDSPYCCNCFYVLDSQNKILVFKSNTKTKHAADMELQKKVAGSILPNLTAVGEMKGIQFIGKVVTIDNELTSKRLCSLYYSKYPFAKVVSGRFWFIQLGHVKMTDNKLGIGKKTIWNKK